MEPTVQEANRKTLPGPWRDAGLTTDATGRTKVAGPIRGPVFGPVDSRRYGRSLGISPFPEGWKVCTFDCVYCECGPTKKKESRVPSKRWPEVAQILEEVLHRIECETRAGRTLDAVTFAGNGEPTVYPHFLSLMKGLVSLKRVKTPNTRIVVLTNGTLLDNESVEKALRLADEACFKLDAGTSDLLESINAPRTPFSIEKYVAHLAKFRGGLVIQSLFFSGRVSNVGEPAVTDWISKLYAIQPSRVDLYSLDRKAPDPALHAVSVETLEKIACRAEKETGVPVAVYG